MWKLTVFCFFSLGMVLAPLVTIVATIDLSAMKAGRMDIAGNDGTRAAQIIGIATVILYLLTCCIAFARLVTVQP
jgi:hypothetical protein